EKDGAEIEIAAAVLVEEVEQVPGNRAVGGERGDQTQPVAEHEGGPAGVDQQVVEQGGERQQREADQPQPRHDQRVELDEARALAPFRLGGIDLKIERAAGV